MSLPNEVSPLLFAQQEYEIARSLRLNIADSAYLSRTFAGASDTKKWTWSGWLKRSTVSNGGYQTFFSAGTNSSNFDYLGFNSSTDDNRLIFGIVSGGGDVVRVSTNRLFRDFSAWYHIVVVYDSAQATAADRVKVYVNGTQETSFFETTYPSLNGVSFINGSSAHNIGRNNVLATRYYGGYLAEINFIDGQALTPSSFGETSSTTGVWIPKRYSGTYGTNGFYLSFANNASTTTLGYDDAGGIAGSGAGSNDWTLNNFSVTAGVGNDSLSDTPTNNYTNLSVLQQNASSTGASGSSVTNGGLTATFTITGTERQQRTGMATPPSGKWYAEVTVSSGSDPVTSECQVGVVSVTALPGDRIGGVVGGVAYSWDGQKEVSAVRTSYGSTYTVNDVIGIAIDLDSGTPTVTFYKNNVSQGSINLPHGLVPHYFGVTGRVNSSSIVYNLNFGQRAFAYTPPTGYNSLCTQNLPTPSIIKPTSYFNTVTWTGTGATRSITGVGFQPDLVWSKSRSNAETHKLVDSTRGATKALSSETTGDEVTESGITSFDADGFTIDGATDTGYNTNTYTYVGWSWKKGVTPGFDIVTYTGNGSARTISHSLGAVPHFMIVKARTTAGTDQGWPVYHRNNTTAPETDYLLLNSTAGTADLDTIWNDTAPTSSVFSVGTNALVNTNNDTYLAYLWTEISGFSRFGSYTGNGSADGPFVYCGFKPRFTLIKATSYSGEYWWIHNSVIGTINPIYTMITPTLTNAEASSNSSAGYNIDFLSNGFKIRTTNSALNSSGHTYIVAAFAENPFRYARAR